MNGYAKSLFYLISIVVIIFFIRGAALSQTEKNSVVLLPCSWSICSIDTMKMSRDKARAELNNPEFDETIKQEARLIAETGANYIAVDTPYDEEFLPFLKRWVSAAREENLHVWFRGNFSSWEGWFEYPKNMSPEEHLKKTHEFIVNNSDLFEDGDIFDACPECENAGHWKQPERNKEYNQFITDQAENTASAFKQINKKVSSNYPSIIGGRAREVLDAPTIDALGKVATIDHYFKDPENLDDYIKFFRKEYNANTLVSEFGAPIPDMNGAMNESEQAAFVEKVFEIMYRNQVTGVNYWVLSEGTPAIVNADGSKRLAYDVIKKYFQPGYITGTVRDQLGQKVSGVKMATSNSVTTVTDKNGNYVFAVPVRTVTLEAGGDGYSKDSTTVTISSSGQKVEKDFTLTPLNPSFIYKVKLFFKDKKWF